MRLLIQRVRDASVVIDGTLRSAIGPGLLVFAGIGSDDGDEDIAYLVRKLVQLRIFDDAQGTMNLDVRQTGGEVLVVSQFTLMASTRRGNRRAGSGVATALRTVRRGCRGGAGPAGRHGRLRRRHAGVAHQRRPRDPVARFEKQRITPR